MSTKQTKRILRIGVARLPDDSPDTSWLGEYSNTPGPFAIARNIPGQYHYFNPGSVEPFDPAASWIPADTPDKQAYWRQTMEKNAAMDYNRMESLNRGDWQFIGIRACADITINGIGQSIYSGGLWGIESDSEESYLAEEEANQLAELRTILHDLGFSLRAIATAIKEVTRN